MTEKVLKTYYNYIDIPVRVVTKCNSSDGTTSLKIKPTSQNGEIVNYTDRAKHYRGNRIIRVNNTKDWSYSSDMPKSGSGYFEVNDSGIKMVGKLENGKVIELGALEKRLSKTDYRSIDVLPQYMREYIESFLKQAEGGKLKLENLTKVMMKKALVYLPK